MTDIILSQLTDPFRIGLMVALVITMMRTSAVTGRVIPLLAGVAFIAVMLPSTMSSPSVGLVDAILAGLISNVIILAPLLMAAALYTRFKR